ANQGPNRGAPAQTPERQSGGRIGFPLKRAQPYSCPGMTCTGTAMRIIRCFILATAALTAATAASASAWAQDFKVTLLGTGTPFPVPDRFGAATLVEAGS